MFRNKLVGLVIAFAICFAITPTLSQAEASQPVRFDVAFTAFMACANAGQGEYVDFTGSLYLQDSQTYHVRYDLVGIGQTTGQTYNSRPSVVAHTIVNSNTTTIHLLDRWPLAGTNTRFHATFVDGVLVEYYMDTDGSCR